jgi:hypothetical protein
MAHMDAGLAAILGGILGGLSTAMGSLMVSTRIGSIEREKSRQQSKQEAYRAAIHSLLEAQRMRSYLTADGSAVLSREHQKDWFDALIEAEYWLTVLLTVCSARHSEVLQGCQADLSALILVVSSNTDGVGGELGHLFANYGDAAPAPPSRFEILDATGLPSLHALYAKVVECARLETADR